MEREELLKELETLSERAKLMTNDRQVIAAAAVLIALRASMKEGETVSFMNHALDWTQSQVRRIEARRN